MADGAAVSDTVLITKRVFDAPREAVFDTWINADTMAKWMGPHGVRAEIDALDANVGGRYRIIMHPEPGGTPTVGGVFREMKRPERLVLTWQWETGGPNDAPGADTLITLTFADVGGKTEMTMRHEGFANADARNTHEHGWTGSFDKLADALKA
jgi:uncharacterized protein YndB with AHSA1/START domain